MVKQWLEDGGRAAALDLGAVNLTKAVLPEMLRRRSGRICFTSSGVGVTGFTGISAYAASKDDVIIWYLRYKKNRNTALTNPIK